MLWHEESMEKLRTEVRLEEAKACTARDERFNFDPAQRRSWPFYRVARAGLTGAQILDLLDAVAAAPADETVQQVIDRVLPVGA